MPSLQYDFLTAEHVQALREVDFRLGFVNHGRPWGVPPNTYVTGARETDYNIVPKFLVGDMVPDRGDVMGVELPDIGYELKTEDEVKRVLRREAMTMFSDLLIPQLDAGTLEDTLELARHLRAICPLDYALGHAMVRGAAIRLTDPSDRELANEGFEPPDLRFPFSQGNRLAACRPYRDARAIQNLGDAAIEMLSAERERGERPILGYIGGLSHALGIKQQLKAHDVPFRVKETSLLPSRSKLTRGLAQAEHNFREVQVGTWASLLGLDYIARLQRRVARAQNAGRLTPGTQAAELLAIVS